ncbi:MAG: glycosyltransferase family 39 protein, partial [Halobacteriota archaeon]
MVTKRYALLLGIVLIGLFLRVCQLGTANIYNDEAITIYISKFSLPQLLPAASQLDMNPPLYHFILHYWVALFGDSEFAVRFLSVVFGVLAIPMTFVVGRQLFDDEVGLLGALILALSQFNIQQSQEVRMYSLMLLLALLSMYFFLQLLRKSGLAIAAGYVLVTTLLLYTHIYGFFVILAQDIYLVALLLLLGEKTLRLKQWIVLQVIAIGLFALWLPELTSHLSTAERGFWLAVPTLGDLITTFNQLCGGMHILFIFLVLSVLALFRYTKTTGSMDWKSPLKALRDYSWNVQVTNITSVTLLVVLLLTPIVVPFVISHLTTPIYVIKYTIAASVALYLLAASGIRNINWRSAKIAVIAVIVILSAASLQGYYSQAATRRGQAQDAFQFVVDNAQSGDVVIVYPGFTNFTFDYYVKTPNIDVKAFPSVQSYSMSWTWNIEEGTKELQSD